MMGVLVIFLVGRILLVWTLCVRCRRGILVVGVQVLVIAVGSEIVLRLVADGIVFVVTLWAVC